MVKQEPKRDAAREIILERILHLDLEPGANINESKLADELGISRTPLREALLSLEREGFVRSQVNRGFQVSDLTLQEAREVYPVLWTLEGLALRESGALVATVIPDLEKANARLQRSSKNPERALEADALFHSSLLSRCPNAHLLGLIATQRQLLERFERVYMRDPNGVMFELIEPA